MNSFYCESLGAGAYDLCCLVLEPTTLKELVIKIFKKDGLDDLVEEAINLTEARVPGVQRLIAACVEARQLLLHYAGITVDKYFRKPISFANAIDVILQVSRTLQRMLIRGYVHNDIKNNNICVLNEEIGPVATVIDLGGARRVGIHGIFGNDLDLTFLSRFPWIAPELLRDTHPCSEASDVYGLAYLIKELVGL